MKISIKRITNIICALVFILAAAIAMPLALRKSTAVEAYNPLPIVDYSLAEDGSGSGILGNPWVIKSRDKLNTLVRSNAATASRYFVLGADIDLVGSNWTPIPTLGAGSVFDGNNFRISNMTVSTTTNGGLFGDVKGTVKNVIMTNVAVTVSSSHGGAIAGRSTGTTSYFENIMIESGFVRGSTITSTSINCIGGLVGEVSSGRTEVNKVLNAAKIDAGYFAGGLIGHSTGSATIIMNQCGNVGDVRAYSTSYGYVGGIFGLAEGSSNVTIRNSYNTGSVTSVGTQSGGIMGSAWSGTALVENCFNNSVLNMSSGVRSAIATRSSSTLTIKNCWFNSDLVVPQGGYQVSNNVGSYGTDSGSNTTTQMALQTFVDKMNAGQNPAPFKLMQGGSIALTVFSSQKTFTFVLNDGTANEFRTYLEEGDTTLILPGAGTEGFTVPTKTGYRFTGWKLYEGGVELGEHLNPGTALPGMEENATFIAQYSKVSFTIEFAPDTQGTPSIQGGISFQIGDSVSLLSGVGTWTEHYRWMVQVANEPESYDLLVPLVAQASTLDISALITDNAAGVAFLDNYIEYHAPVGDVVGKLTIKIINVSLVRVIKTASNLPGAPSIEFTVVGSGARSILFGSAISLNLAADVTQIRTINPNKYYTLASYVVRDTNGNQVGAAITDFSGENSVYDSSTDSRFEAANLQNDFTVQAVFTKVPYTFAFSSMLRDTNTNLDHLNLVTETHTPFTIGNAASVNAQGLLEDASRTYHFAAWKLVDKNGSEYYQSTGDINLNFSIADVTELWLEQFGRDDKTVLIVAEYEIMYRISIDVDASQSDFGELSIDVVDGITGIKDTYARLINTPVVKGSFITVRASSADFYQFAKFVGDIALGEISGPLGATAEFQITAERTVTATFDYREYTIVYEPYDADGNNVLGVSGFVTHVNDAVSSTIKIGDRLNYADATNAIKAPGYEFENFTIFNGTDFIEIPDGTIITSDWLLNNFNDVEQFVIVANYAKLIELKLSIGQNSVGMGDLEVYYDGVYTEKREFKEGKDILIVAKPEPYHRLQKFVGAEGTDYVDIDEDNDKYELTIFNFTEIRTITVRFEKTKFNLVDKINNTAIELSGKTDLTIMEDITLTVDVPAGKKICKWTIGIGANQYDVLKMSGYANNMVTITLDKAFLDTLQSTSALGFDFYSDVSFAMTEAILMMIIIPCAVVPLLLAIFIVYVVLYRKKSSFIKKQLMAEQKAQVTVNAGKFIQDLKEGKSVGQITKEDIKRARKNKK